MKDVKRYDMCGSSCVDHYENADGQYVHFSDYEATQVELAALREELAETRKAAKEELDGANYMRRAFRKERDTLQIRLDAAEQRNSELLKAVEQSIKWFETMSSGDGSGHADLAVAIRRIAKLPKPTESGASE